MKYALSTAGETLDSAMDPRFGRTKYFLFYDSGTGEFSAVANTQNLQAAQGAGIQSAVRVAENQADIVISGHCGPKAFKVLAEAGISVYLTTAATAKEAIKLFEDGKLVKAENADVEGHWA